MRFCQHHWDGLNGALKERGLYHLVAKTKPEAAARMLRKTYGEEPDPDSFDPLLNAHWAIWSRYADRKGIAALVWSECPLCGVEAKYEGLAEDWIEGAADDELETARLLKLAPALQ